MTMKITLGVCTHNIRETRSEMKSVNVSDN
jgi:hypothetical protein